MNTSTNKALLARQLFMTDGALTGVSFEDQAGKDLLLTLRELIGTMAMRLSQGVHPDPVFIENYLPAPMSNFRRTANWLTKCGKVPGTRDASVQFGVHLEEVAENLDEVTIASMTGVDGVVLNEASRLLKHVGNSLKSRSAHIIVHDRGEFLDGLSDMEVTANGVAFLLGMDKEGHDAQVLDKNDDKFQDGQPVILPGGKIGRRAGWTPPDNEAFAGVMPADPPLQVDALQGTSLDEAVDFVGAHFASYDRDVLASALMPLMERVAAEASAPQDDTKESQG